MHTELRLVFVADVVQVLEYKMLGNKVVRGPEFLQLNYAPERDSDKKQGFFQKQSLPGTFYDPHTSFKLLEYEQSTRALAHYLSELVLQPGPKAYKELVVISSPKFIGHFKKHEIKAIKPYVRTIVKNLLNHHNIAYIKELLPGLLRAS